ncbi:MAG: hydrogenase maturation nickel metallochaperone HypA [Bacteroidetes bacterium]|nr:hydrogenase maturation nickel metallochaperone HypA [Bacteroidota bacterium]
MHELSLAQNIIEMMNDAVPAEKQHRVKTIHLEAGAFSGVVPDSLAFALDCILPDSGFPKARAFIHEIPFTVYCKTCKRKRINNSGISICEECGSSEIEILSGTELILKAIELGDE